MKNKNIVRYTPKGVTLNPNLLFKKFSEITKEEENTNPSMVPNNATDAWLYLIVDKKIVGAIEYGINGNRINISNLRVDEKYQRRGYATQLMLYVLNQVEENLDSVTLYPKVSGKGCPQEKLEEFYSNFSFGQDSNHHIVFENI